MARFRRFLACLLLVAIPLQGFAAATMLFCHSSGQAQQSAGVAQEHRHHEHGAAAEDGHAMHQHAGHNQAAGEAGQQSDAAKLTDLGQKCSACAACCHSVGISDTPRVPTLSGAPQIVTAESAAAVYSRPSSVPDKPPRA